MVEYLVVIINNSYISMGLIWIFDSIFFIFYDDCTILHFPILTNNCYFPFICYSFPRGHEVVSHYDFELLFLMTNVFKHLFIFPFVHLLWIHVYSYPLSILFWMLDLYEIYDFQIFHLIL